jgi:hypothetical protein
VGDLVSRPPVGTGQSHGAECAVLGEALAAATVHVVAVPAIVVATIAIGKSLIRIRRMTASFCRWTCDPGQVSPRGA